ncbi:MAG: proteasome activator [Acidimicrobiales bacterium]
MTDGEEQTAAEKPEIVTPEGELPGDGPEQEGPQEFIEQPAKVMRVGSMLRQLLDELHQADFDENSRDRLRDIYETSVVELGSALSPDLRNELDRITLPFSDDEIPSEAELRVAKAQLVGWLEGLIQGIQATLFAQQMAAQQQLANMRGQIGPGGPPGRPGPQGPGAPGPDNPELRPGTYL